MVYAEPSFNRSCKTSFSTFSVRSLSSSVSQAVKQRCTYSFMAWGQSCGRVCAPPGAALALAGEEGAGFNPEGCSPGGKV